MPAPPPATASINPVTTKTHSSVCFENSISKLIYTTHVIDCLFNLQTNRVDLHVISNHKQSFILAGIGVK